MMKQKAIIEEPLIARDPGDAVFADQNVDLIPKQIKQKSLEIIVKQELAPAQAADREQNSSSKPGSQVLRSADSIYNPQQEGARDQNRRLILSEDALVPALRNQKQI